jgi:hypothetical protein
VLFGEALGWLHQHLSGGDTDADGLPVRVHVGETGAPGTWRDLADWPPPGFAEHMWYLRADGYPRRRASGGGDAVIVPV